MLRIVFSFLLMIAMMVAAGQKSIDGLIQAEKNFAAFSVANGMKEAFLHFLDSNGIVFDRGKPVNGKQLWNNRERVNGILDWQPQIAEITVTGDFGYTTGPWTFRESASDSVISRGQYTTVWHTDTTGEWKFIIDLGVNNTPPLPVNEVKKISITAAQAKTPGTTNIAPIFSLEIGFAAEFKIDKHKAYQRYLSEKSLLSRNNHAPALGAAEQQALIDLTPSTLAYTFEGWMASPAEDMAVAYGSVEADGKQGNYQRIWRREKDDWKIAVEVIKF